MISESTRDKWDRQISFLFENMEQSGLTAWETDFVDSISIRREFGKDLSIQQAITLSRIFKKAEERIG